MNDNEIKDICSSINKKNNIEWTRWHRYYFNRNCKFKKRNHKVNISRYKIRQCIHGNYMDIVGLRKLMRDNGLVLKRRISKHHYFIGTFVRIYKGYDREHKKRFRRYGIILLRSIKLQGFDYNYKYSFGFGRYTSNFKRLGRLTYGTRIAFKAKIYCNRISAATGVHLVPSNF